MNLQYMTAHNRYSLIIVSDGEMNLQYVTAQCGHNLVSDGKMNLQYVTATGRAWSVTAK